MKKLTTAVVLIGDAESCPDLEYATGFRATDPVVAVRHARRYYVVVPRLEFGRASRACQGCRVYTPESLGLPAAARRGVHNWAIAILRRLGVRRAMVLPTFPVGAARALEKAGVRVRIEDELFPQRAVKSDREVRKIRNAQRAAVAAMRAAIGMIGTARIGRDGKLRHAGSVLRAEQVQREIRRVLLEHDCAATMTIVAGGKQSADPHERGQGPLKAQQPIVLDIFPRGIVHGYWGDITRTIVRGRASGELRAMYDAVRAAHQGALRKVKAGVSGATIHRGVREEFESRGFETRMVDGTAEGFFHSTGHGVGMEIHEAPGIGISPVRLRAGNVVTIEPGLYYPHIGGVRIEDTVLVTKSGYKMLAHCDKSLEV